MKCESRHASRINMDTSLIPQLNEHVEIGEADVTKTATRKANQADFAVKMVSLR